MDLAGARPVSETRLKPYSQRTPQIWLIENSERAHLSGHYARKTRRICGEHAKGSGEEFADGDEIRSSLPDFVENLIPQDRDTAALNAALPAIYEDLREMASSYLRRERPDHTLQPTALVHESYLRLVGQHAVDWNNRLHFLSVAARMMRRILSNYAAARKTDKRGKGEPRLELDAALELYDRRAVDIGAVDEALRGLEEMDPRQARVVELRFFGGLTTEETAELLGLSVATVKRDWLTARRWLKRGMSSR